MIILSANKCELGYDGGRRMSIYNNSGKPICYEMLWKKGIFYPDTILPENNTNPHPINKEWHFSLAYTENTLFATFPTDTMSIFFFDPDTLAKYDWQIIRSDYKILVRYDFSHNDLNMLNWCIYYPPIEEMRNMKMYPPYE
jgi:hypothetical protein